MDRITRVRIENVRAIEHIDLELSRPVTVLIGENGSGKSTIIECLELLHKAIDPRFMPGFYAIHRGLPALLRKGARSMTLGVVIEDDSGVLPRVEYVFTLAAEGAGGAIKGERMLVGPTGTEHAGLLPDPELAAARAEVEALGRTSRKGKRARDKRAASDQLPLAEQRLTALEARARRRETEPLLLLSRTDNAGEMFDRAKGEMVPLPPQMLKFDQLVLAGFGSVPPHGAIERIHAVLGGVETHLGFDTLAAWAARSHQRPTSVRAASTLFPADRLNLLGVNLASAWSDLRGRESAHWERTMALVRLGLGEHVDSVTVPPDAGGGNVYLALRFTKAPEPILASDLSDGQLAWLAFVAMVRLNEQRSLLAVDEPELHLHPQLLGGVFHLLASVASPVVIATHSDHLLELLDDPADAVRVCELDEQGRATLAGVDPEELERWLAHYGDLGQLRAAGYLSRVLRHPADRAEEAE